MASQITKSIPLSASPSAPGGVIALNSFTEGSPTAIHVVGSDTTVQHAMFVEFHNNSADRVKVHVFWNSVAASYATAIRVTYNIPAYSTEIISSGLRLGFDTNAVNSVALAAYLDDSGDTDKVVVRGYAIEIDQPLA